MSRVRLIRRFATMWAALAITGPSLTAQVAPCRIDSAAAVDTARGILILRRAARADTTELLSLFDHQLVAQEIAARFKRPDTVTFMPWTGIVPPRTTAPGGTHAAAGWLAPGTLAIVFDERGFISAASWIRLPASYDIGSKVLVALGRAAVDGAISVDLSHKHRTPAHLWLDMDLVDSVPAGALPLMRLAIPVLRADKEAVPVVRPLPDYPEKGIHSDHGYADIVGIIGEDGRPDPSTLRVLFASEPPYGPSAYQAVLHSIFQPATLQGCAVAVPFVQQVRYVREHL